MGGISFKTAADGKVHELSEKLGFVPSSEYLYRVHLRNENHDLAGGSVTGGPLVVGSERQVSAVLQAPGTTYTDSIDFRNCRLEDIVWNDLGTACQLSVTWGFEAQPKRPVTSAQVPETTQ